MQAYRDAMKYFVVFALFIFPGRDVLPRCYPRHFISPAYFSGLKKWFRW